MSMNHLTIEGNLADDPKLTHISRGMTAVTEAVVLVNRRTKDATGEWTDGEPTRHRIKAWNQLAENLAALRVGARVLVVGHIETDTWKDSDTNQRRSADIVVVEAIGASLRFNSVTIGAPIKTTEAGA